MDALEQLSAARHLPHRMGVVVVEASPERVVGTMPVEGNTQVYGLLHGGASCVLAETLGSVGAMLYAVREGYGLAVGVDINATHHRAVRTGTVTGVATPVHLGRSMASYEIVITDEAGRRVCTARLTCAVRAAPRSTRTAAPGESPGDA
jgi:1,4-dihydroxy-2-naphthoyl-CoA hydrolase